MPFHNPSGAPNLTICEICAGEVPPRTGYPIVFEGVIDGYACMDCYIKDGKKKAHIPGFEFATSR